MMAYETESGVLYVNGGCNTQTECPLDADFLLPEYCADIAAVMKCLVKPVVLSRQWSGDNLLVDGQSVIRVLYLDEQRKNVRSFECVQPFSCTLKVEEGFGSVLPQVKVRVNYLNCRAVGPRRLDIHGALTVSGCTHTSKPLPVVSDIRGAGVHTRKETVFCSEWVDMAEKNFSIGEVVDIGANRPAAQNIIRTACTPLITDVRQLTDKVIVKGNVHLHTLYTVSEEEGTTAAATHQFPFSQIVDMVGMDENMVCVPQVECPQYDVQVTADPNGMGTLLAVNVKLCVRLEAARAREISVVTDAYTERFPVKNETVKLCAEPLTFSRIRDFSLKEVLELPSADVSEVIDLWCDVTSTTQRMEADHGYIDGHLQIAMLARHKDGTVAYYEHTGEFTLQTDDHCHRMTATVVLPQVDYSVVGNTVEIRMEPTVYCCGWGCYETAAITQFEPLAEPYPAENVALRLCRVKKGEHVWEIAKSSHTDMHTILAENALESEIIPRDMMLMVPLH